MTPPNFSTASGVGLQERSRLRNLFCEPDIVRPRHSPARGRIVPMARPMRGRAMADPARFETLNGVAGRRGALIKVNGHLIPRCECCFDCPKCMQKITVSSGCACVPLAVTLVVSGISLCVCQCMNFPAIEPCVHATGVSPDGEYCHVMSAPTPIAISGGVKVWGNDKPDCSGPPDEAAGAVLYVLNPSMNPMTWGVDIVVGSAFLGTATLFTSLQEFPGNCYGPWVLNNEITVCGNPDGGEANVGKFGTVSIYRCCPPSI